MTAPVIDHSFPRRWDAEILAGRPLILPPRHYVYPREAEEIERGALEVLIKPLKRGAPGLDSETWNPKASVPDDPRSDVQPFLATCALGFRDPVVPTGVWSTPDPQKLCAVSGGYAYIIDATAPERFTMLSYRPVLNIRAVPASGLLLFVGHYSILAWGANGQAWESGKLSDEGVTITRLRGSVLEGLGWHMVSDREMAFTLDLRTGQPTPSGLEV